MGERATKVYSVKVEPTSRPLVLAFVPILILTRPWKFDVEAGSLSWLRLKRNAAVHMFDSFAHDCEADAAAGVFVVGVPLKHFEYSFVQTFFNPNTVVFDENGRRGLLLDVDVQPDQPLGLSETIFEGQQSRENLTNRAVRADNSPFAFLRSERLQGAAPGRDAGLQVHLEGTDPRRVMHHFQSCLTLLQCFGPFPKTVCEDAGCDADDDKETHSKSLAHVSNFQYSDRLHEGDIACYKACCRGDHPGCQASHNRRKERRERKGF